MLDLVLCGLRAVRCCVYGWFRLTLFVGVCDLMSRVWFGLLRC